MLTTSPVVNDPADLISQLKALGRWDVLVNAGYFLETYCHAPDLSELEDNLRIYCMVRRTEGALSAYLPGKIVTPV